MTRIPGWNREELAWAAGFFDGEGTVCCSTVGNGKGTLSLKLRIPNREFAPIARFWNAVGQIGSINGPYERTSPTDSPRAHPIGVFQSHRFEHIQAIVAMLWKWLSEPKKRQITKEINKYITWRRSV